MLVPNLPQKGHEGSLDTLYNATVQEPGHNMGQGAGEVRALTQLW